MPIQRMVIPVVVLAAVLLLLASGCARIRRPNADLAERQMALPAAFVEAAERQAAEVRDSWLADFEDDTLLSLADEAMRNNPDLRAAAARREEAEARVRVAGSFLRPRLDAFGGAARQDIGIGAASLSNRYDAGLQVGWEADLWGRLRSDRAAEREFADASALEYRFARYSLAASVADAWFVAIAAERQFAIDRDLLEAERFTAKVTRDKIDVGAGTRLDGDIADANVALAEEAVRRDRGAILEATRALEVLLGRYPAAELELAAELPEVGGEVPVGLPSQLLERRPDVAAADRRVSATFYGVRSAQAARLPRVNLSASLGTLLDPSNTIWSIGANLLAPIYAGGELEPRVDVATAQQRRALADYVSVSLDAFREVETALANEQFLRERELQLERAESSLRSASATAEDRYRAGILGILDLTQVRRQDFETRSQLLRVRLERLRQRLTLHLALGGSFEAEAQTQE